MESKEFKTMVVTETGEKTFSREITTKSIDELPQGEVIVKVNYSSLNYKDALSATGNKGVTRNYPHTPLILRGVRLLGIDSQNCPMALRSKIWERLAGDWKLEVLEELSREISLEDLEENIQLMLQGKSKGRTVVKI